MTGIRTRGNHPMMFLCGSTWPAAVSLDRSRTCPHPHADPYARAHPCLPSHDALNALPPEDSSSSCDVIEGNLAGCADLSTVRTFSTPGRSYLRTWKFPAACKRRITLPVIELSWPSLMNPVDVRCILRGVLWTAHVSRGGTTNNRDGRLVINQ